MPSHSRARNAARRIPELRLLRSRDLTEISQHEIPLLDEPTSDGDENQGQIH